MQSITQLLAKAQLESSYLRTGQLLVNVLTIYDKKNYENPEYEHDFFERVFRITDDELKTAFEEWNTFVAKYKA